MASTTMVEQLQSELTAGKLLELMDLAACLAAEEYAGASAVTAAVDEFQLDETTCKPGDVLTLSASVNRAWGTSMEVGCLVSYEKMREGAELDVFPVCRAYFVFVALAPDGVTKIRLPPFKEPKEPDALRRFLEAQERRRIRLSRRNLIQVFEDAQDTQYPKEGVDPAVTAVSKTNLVLPQNANHHGSLFGGAMMRNASEAAFVSASRFHRGARLHSVDDIAFRKKIRIGDRMTARSIVNRSFGDFLEVGVRVERLAVGADAVMEHALSCFMIFVLPPGCGKVLAPTSEEHKRRWRAAQGRRSVRLERQLLRSGQVTDVPTYNSSALSLLCYNNVKSLLAVYNSNLFSGAWNQLLSDSDVSLSINQGSADVTGIKITGNCKQTPERLLEYMLEGELRKTWDLVFRSLEKVEDIDDENDIVRAQFMSSPTAHKEFVLLRSWRKEESGRIIYAARSIKHGEKAPETETERGIVASSGAILEPEEDGTTHLTYLLQLSTSALSLLKGDLVGNQPVVFKSVLRLVKLE